MKQRQSSYAIAGQAAVAFAAVVWGFLFARYMLATMFQAYDDEGYFMMRLAHYLQPGPLNPGTFSHYGPFFYYAQAACLRLVGLPLSHDAGRLITLLDWMACAILGGVFVYRISRSVLLGAAATLACIRVASVLAYEPGHPQQVIVVLFTLAGCLAVSVGSRPKSLNLFLMGALGAALVFTKINVGAFFLAALGHALVCLLPASRLRAAGIAAFLTYALLAPPLLARPHLWADSGGFCLVACLCTAATFAWGAMAKTDTPLEFRRAWVAAAGALSAGALLVTVARLQGMSLPALAEDVVLLPARQQSGLEFLGFRLGLVPCLFTVLVLAGIAGLGWFRDRLAPYRFWLGALRAGVGLGVIFLLVRTDLSWVVPFLPLGVIPITGRTWGLSEWFPRLFIADLGATQFLHTYPVAGSHIGVSSVPVLLWAFVCLSDGLEEMGGPACRPAFLTNRALCNGAAGVLVLVVVCAGMWRSGLRGATLPYPTSRLKGASLLHLPPQQAENYRFLAGTIAGNCSLLYGEPRAGSLNFWSGVPAPKGSEAPMFIKVTSPETQKSVVDQLRSEERACVLYNRGVLEFFQTTPQDLARLPLARYIDDMPKAAERGGFEIRIHPHRTSRWVVYSANGTP